MEEEYGACEGMNWEACVRGQRGGWQRRLSVEVAAASNRAAEADNLKWAEQRVSSSKAAAVSTGALAAHLVILLREIIVVEDLVADLDVRFGVDDDLFL